MKTEGFNNYGAIGQDQERQDNNFKSNNDYEAEMRRGFIRKVYGIVFVQLLITAACCLLAMTNKDIAHFQRKNEGVKWAAIIASIILVLVLSCYTEIARKVPINYLLLMLFTACEAYLVSLACVLTKNPKVVIMAATMTCALVFALTLYACVTDTDFTVFGGIFFCLGIGIFVASLFAMFTQNKTLHIIISACAVVLFSLYLIYDTQKLLGRHSYSLDYDDYILGAMMIYIDIVVIFMEMMNLMR
jgi:FtsH-binding integral membrane protein